MPAIRNAAAGGFAGAIVVGVAVAAGVCGTHPLATGGVASGGRDGRLVRFAQASDEGPRCYVPVALARALVASPPTAIPSPTPAGTIATAYGPVTGTKDGGTWRFLGIPYASPPIGDLRWRPPRSPEVWDQPRAADAFGPACPQYAEAGTVFGEEDCLTLNLWTPVDAPGARREPILVFLHGGGHEQGSSSVHVGDLPLYDGRQLAEDHDVVVVTVNYRLGPFGFLAHPELSSEGGATASGNYGALDQLAALEWVRENAIAFGGDPGRVTVFGESAGSVSTCRVVASPLARGLVHRAVLMSGSCVATPLATAERNGMQVAEALGCGDARDVPACLRAATTADVMATLDPMANGTDHLGRGSYDGVIDGYLLPDAPSALIESGVHNAVPVMLGTTSAENGRNAPPITTGAELEAAVRAYFAATGLPAALADRALAAYPADDYASPRDAYVALTSDLKFVCPARRDAARFVSAQDEPVYRYWFDHVPENVSPGLKALGASHGSELPFLFGVLEVGAGRARYRPGTGDLAVSAMMQGAWARFARTGDPNGAGLPDWPDYDPVRDPSLVIAPTPTVQDGIRASQCGFWASLGGR